MHILACLFEIISRFINIGPWKTWHVSRVPHMTLYLDLFSANLDLWLVVFIIREVSTLILILFFFPILS